MIRAAIIVVDEPIESVEVGGHKSFAIGRFLYEVSRTREAIANLWKAQTIESRHQQARLRISYTLPSITASHSILVTSILHHVSHTRDCSTEPCAVAQITTYLTISHSLYRRGRASRKARLRLSRERLQRSPSVDLGMQQVLPTD